MRIQQTVRSDAIYSQIYFLYLYALRHPSGLYASFWCIGTAWRFEYQQPSALYKCARTRAHSSARVSHSNIVVGGDGGSGSRCIWWQTNIYQFSRQHIRTSSNVNTYLRYLRTNSLGSNDIDISFRSMHWRTYIPKNRRKSHFSRYQLACICTCYRIPFGFFIDENSRTKTIERLEQYDGCVGISTIRTLLQNFVANLHVCAIVGCEFNSGRVVIRKIRLVRVYSWMF